MRKCGCGAERQSREAGWLNLLEVKRFSIYAMRRRLQHSAYITTGRHAAWRRQVGRLGGRNSRPLSAQTAGCSLLPTYTLMQITQQSRELEHQVLGWGVCKKFVVNRGRTKNGCGGGAAGAAAVARALAGASWSSQQLPEHRH